MADISIRNVPDDVYDTLKKKAAEDGKGLETWLREHVILVAAQPTIRKRYSFKAYGEDGAQVQIRYEFGNVQSRGAKNCSQEQYDAYKKALAYCERNEMGDYEAAYKLLLQHFDEVFPG